MNRLSKLVRVDNKKARMKKVKILPTFNHWTELPHIPISLGVSGSIGKTGEWRTYRPVIDADLCNKCGFCYMYCPEGTISFDKQQGPEIDYEYCKGCGICVEECPRGAMTLEEVAR